MAATTERKIAAAGLATAVLTFFAALFVLSGLVLGLGVRDPATQMTASTGEDR